MKVYSETRRMCIAAPKTPQNVVFGNAIIAPWSKRDQAWVCLTSAFIKIIHGEALEHHKLEPILGIGVAWYTEKGIDCLCLSYKEVKKASPDLTPVLCRKGWELADRQGGASYEPFS